MPEKWGGKKKSSKATSIAIPQNIVIAQPIPPVISNRPIVPGNKPKYPSRPIVPEKYRYTLDLPEEEQYIPTNAELFIPESSRQSVRKESFVVPVEYEHTLDVLPPLSVPVRFDKTPLLTSKATYEAIGPYPGKYSTKSKKQLELSLKPQDRVKILRTIEARKDLGSREKVRMFETIVGDIDELEDSILRKSTLKKK